MERSKDHVWGHKDVGYNDGIDGVSVEQIGSEFVVSLSPSPSNTTGIS